MSNPFRRIYPDKGDGFITLDGGLSSKFPRSLLPNNESPDCLNVVFNEGGVETRQGSTKVNTTAVGSYVFDGLYTRKSNTGAETMVAFANGSAYALATTTFVTIASAQSVFTAGNRVGAALYENHLFAGDGQAIPYKYNGTDWTRHGVYPPTTTHTAATNSNGTLTGDYQYKVTWVNSQSVESDVGPVNSTFTAASEEVLISSIPVAPQSFGIASRNIYRTEAGGTTFKLQSAINDNSTTTLVDNKSDSELGVAAPTDQGVPPTYRVVVYHQDRLFMIDPDENRVAYTELGEPYTVKATNFLTIGDNTGDIPRVLYPYNNGIVVKGDKTITMIYMPDTTDSNWLKLVLQIPYGSMSPFGAVELKNRLFFPASKGNTFLGFASLVGTSIKPEANILTALATGSDFNSYKIEDQMANVQTNYLENISSFVYKNNIYISVTYGSAETENNRIYVLNFEQDNLSKVQKFAWAPWSGLSIAQFTEYGGDLYGASSLADGFVYKLNDGTYNDDGVAINSYIWTKEFSGFKGEENYHKDFKDLFFLVDNLGDWFMDVFVRIDSDTGQGDVSQIDLNPGGSLWGTVVGGVDDWGGGVDQTDIREFLSGQSGKRIQLKFSNQNVIDQAFKVNRLKFSYNRKGLR